MKYAAKITLLGGSTLLPSLSLVSASDSSSPSAAVSSLSELPYDENDHLASHLLIYSDGKCADLIEGHYAGDSLGFNFQPVNGEAEAAFFEGAGGVLNDKASPDSMEDCRAVCVERGVDRSLVEHVMPERHYDGGLRFRDWFHDNCRKTEACFMNYHDKNAVVDMYWVHHETGQKRLNSQIEYGERKTRCINTFIGHRFIFEDSQTGEELLDYTVQYTVMRSIGESPPYTGLDRDFEKEIKQTLHNEWSRHNRVKRTFSALGFKKGRLPDDLFASMGAFYYNNRDNKVREEWSGKGVFVNWWEHDVLFIQIPWDLKRIWQDRLRKLVEAWTGVELEQTDMYGLRRYEEGARLLTHVDRERTHAASLIVNVAQGNLSEPWPVEVHDHADRLHQVPMMPGDIVYYESAKCLHARNTPLKGPGSYYVNLFTHYRPVGDPDWLHKETPEGTPEPLVDVGECRLEGGGAADEAEIGVGAVKCDDDSIGPYLSPQLFTAKSGDDLVDWWVRVGPRQPDDGRDEL